MLTNDRNRPLGKHTLLSIANPERSFELPFLPVVIHIYPRTLVCAPQTFDATAREGIARRRTEDSARNRQYFVDLMA